MLLCPLFSGSIEAVISKSSNQGFNSGKVTNIAIIWKKQGIVAKFPLIWREVKQINSLLFPVMTIPYEYKPRWLNNKAFQTQDSLMYFFHFIIGSPTTYGTKYSRVDEVNLLKAVFHNINLNTLSHIFLLILKLSDANLVL